jgi:hypothetical protein
MLNEVLCTAKEMGIFIAIGKEKTQEFALKLIEIGKDYDCNDGEILEDIGEELGICYCCLNKSDDISCSGLCKKCRGHE